MLKIIGKALLLLVIIAGGLFSAVNTFTLFSSIFGTDLQGVLTSSAGLALFDIGALAWLLFYSHSAQGPYQRAVSAAAAALCLLLTFAAAGVEVLIKQDLISTPEWAAQAAIIAVLTGLAVNLVGAALVHLTDPATLKDIREQATRDLRAETIRAHKERIEREAFRMSEELVNEQAAWVAHRLGDGLKTETIRELLGHQPGGQQAPAVTVIEAQNTPASAPAQEDEPIAAPAGLFTTATEAPAPKARRKAPAQSG